MEFNILILGCLFILVMFGVGESILKFLHLNKYFAMISLALMMSGLFVTNLDIETISINIGFVLIPLLLSLLFIFKIKSASKFFVSLFFCILVALLFTILPIDEIYMLSYIPAIILGVLCGLCLAIINRSFAAYFVSVALGFNIANVIFHLTKYESFSLLGNSYLYTSFLISIPTFAIIAFCTGKLKSISQTKKNEITT